MCENAEQWNETFKTGPAMAERVLNQQQFGNAKGNLLAEGSIGQPMISQFAPTMGQAYLCHGRDVSRFAFCRKKVRNLVIRSAD